MRHRFQELFPNSTAEFDHLVGFAIGQSSKLRRGPFTRADALRVVWEAGVNTPIEHFNVIFDRLVEDALDEVSTGASPQYALPKRVRTNRRLLAHNGMRGARAGARKVATVSSTPSSNSSPSALSPPAPQAPGQGRKAAAQTLNANRVISMVAPVTIDGGTAFVLKAPTAKWVKGLRALFATRDAPPAPSTVSLAVSADGEVETLLVTERRHDRLALEVEHVVRLELYADRCVLIAKAWGLWVRGLEAWMKTWLVRATWLLLQEQIEDLDDAARLGWTTRNVELCADFVGLKFYDEDVRHFVGVRGNSRRVDSRGFKPDGEIETLDLGMRRSNALCISTHDKTATPKVRDAPPATVYADTWKSYGWDGEAPIRRVEVRAKGAALKRRSKDGHLELALTTPASLLDAQSLGRFWAHATNHFRLVVPASVTSGSAPKDLRHQKVDPRWLAVQNAASVPHIRLVVDRTHRVRLCFEELLARAQNAARKALARMEGLMRIDHRHDEHSRTAAIDALRGPKFDALIEATMASASHLMPSPE